MSAKRKNKFKEFGLVLLTIFLLIFIVAGLAFTKTETFHKMRTPSATTSNAAKVTKKSEVAPSQEPQEEPQTVDTPAPPSNEEIEWVTQESPVQLPILMYHAIHVMAPEEAESANLIVDPTIFESHIQALKDNGYYAVSPEEAYKILTENVLPKDKKVVWLTFDDSIWDFYDIAYPILKKYNMKATNNVITGTVGYEANLSLDEMKEMKENGISLQAHTVNHPSLEYVDATTQSSELVGSKQFLDTNLSQDTISIAYPSGSYSEETITLVEQANYKLATTTNEGIASAADGLLTLKRIRVFPTTTSEMLLQTIYTP
ncbi:polysaccharide deacetylase family protein [Streptococcus cameli]